MEEKFTPIFPGERGPLFAASVKLLQFALRASSASAYAKELTEDEEALLLAIRPLVANPDCHFLAVLTALVQSILEGRTFRGHVGEDSELFSTSCVTKENHIHNENVCLEGTSL